jgi:hypothetical protein
MHSTSTSTNVKELMDALKRDVDAFEEEFNRWNYKTGPTIPRPPRSGPTTCSTRVLHPGQHRVFGG